jgi:hypothetical protein
MNHRFNIWRVRRSFLVDQAHASSSPRRYDAIARRHARRLAHSFYYSTRRPSGVGFTGMVSTERDGNNKGIEPQRTGCSTKRQKFHAINQESKLEP